MAGITNEQVLRVYEIANEDGVSRAARWMVEELGVEPRLAPTRAHNIWSHRNHRNVTAPDIPKPTYYEAMEVQRLAVELRGTRKDYIQEVARRTRLLEGDVFYIVNERWAIANLVGGPSAQPQPTAAPPTEIQPARRRDLSSAAKEMHKRRMFGVQHGRCGYCGQSKHWPDMTIDHVKPRGAGGTHDEENLVLACYMCNNMKHEGTVEDLRQKLVDRGLPSNGFVFRESDRRAA